MALTQFGRMLESVDPFHSFDPFRSTLALFDDSNDHSLKFAKEVSAVANTRIDWCETPEAHVYKADLPGLSKGEVKIQVDDARVLSISGERKKEETSKTDKWHRVERAHGSFLRRFTLPEDALVDQITAKVENGVLTVTVPKHQASQEKNVMAIDVK